MRAAIAEVAAQGDGDRVAIGERPETLSERYSIHLFGNTSPLAASG